MKTVLISLLIVGFATLGYCAATLTYVTFEVTDDDGEPVEGARIVADFETFGESDRDDAVTNNGGTALLAGRGSLAVGFKITQIGYYDTIGRKPLEDTNIDVVLREIRNPIAMYARKIDVVRSEWQEEWVKYDFLWGDFLPPHGQGKVADMEVLWNFEKEDFWSVKSDLYVRFPGEGNGLSRFDVEESKWYSEFHSSYEAPIVQYSSEKHFFTYAAGQGSPRETNFERNQANYYFRIRTQVDDEGNVASAHYGKMYGDFNSPGLPYYVNPTPNDRNMEFDRRQNLFRDVPPNERVSAP